ncbi:hypothetical protein [Demequina soli]|uniref:hypothetical protein n=1 Tax=Demequina soli TaxID=1638987 RepID=UPI000A6FFCDD|nr:hypothetical protein [Demequina soli]
MRIVHLDPAANTPWRRAYGIGGDGIVAIRPDGYIAAVVTRDLAAFSADLVPGMVAGQAARRGE